MDFAIQVKANSEWRYLVEYDTFGDLCLSHNLGGYPILFDQREAADEFWRNLGITQEDLFPIKESQDILLNPEDYRIVSLTATPL